MVRLFVGMALVAVVTAGCGGSSTQTGQSSSTTAAAASTGEGAPAPAGDSGTAGDADGGDETGKGSGSVSVHGATYEFSDVTACEVGNDTSADWRQFKAWTDDGRTHVDITLASGADEWLTGFNLAVGLANPRTLDEGNPDEEWTDGYGGSVDGAPTNRGASGTAKVTTLDTSGPIHDTAEWSFTC